MTGVLIVGVGPEQTGETLAGHAAIAGGGEHRQQSKTRRTEPRQGGSVVGFEPQTSKREQAEHSPVTLLPATRTVKRTATEMLRASAQRIGAIVQLTLAFISRPLMRTGIFVDPLIVDTVAGSGCPLTFSAGIEYWTSAVRVVSVL